MKFTVRNTKRNLKNAKIEELYGNLTYKLSKSGKMIIIDANGSSFPYLTTPAQFKKALDFYKKKQIDDLLQKGHENNKTIQKLAS